VFGLAKHGEFTLYEDDGKTTAYLNGAVRKTHMTTQVNVQSADLFISAEGSYSSAPESRDLHIEWVMPDRAIAKVMLNGEAVSQWDYNNNLLVIDAGPFQVSENQRVEVQFR
jgi:alpha-glucosidase